MPASLQIPKLYPILDSSGFQDAEAMLLSVENLLRAGVRIIQYRNKSGDARTMLDQARELKFRVGSRAILIMNDRADLCLSAEFDGVHVGQDDLSPESVRRIIGSDCWLGVSTHNPEQVAEADHTSANYIAVGPVFATSSKARPDPVIGIDGVRRARQLTKKPLVAIGGITRENCLLVVEAGADSLAVISDLVRDPCKSAEEFLRILG